MTSSNTCYRLKVYETPDGGYVMGKLPANIENKHYGPHLIRFILYQHYHCHVTQPLLLEQLHEIGVDISTGHLNSILIEEKERFHYRDKMDMIWHTNEFITFDIGKFSCFFRQELIFKVVKIRTHRMRL